MANSDDDLITWLRDELDERERRILDGWDSDGRARVATMWTGPETGWTTVASDHRDDRWVADGREVTDARHVRILWDPAQELADVEATRRILDLHQPTSHPDHPGAIVCEHCNDLCHSETGLMCDSPDAPYPCLTVRLLAWPFAERPGYRQEWAP